jgi:hypothetical protein
MVPLLPLGNRIILSNLIGCRRSLYAGLDFVAGFTRIIWIYPFLFSFFLIKSGGGGGGAGGGVGGVEYPFL